MKIDSYYYIYSAMTQSMGALIALIGVFIIFRVQIQRERLKEVYAILERLSFPGQPRKQIDEGVKAKLEDKEKLSSVGPINKHVIQLCDDLVNQKNILEYTIQQGKIAVAVTSFVFIFYIIALNGNDYFFASILRLPVLILGLLLAIGIVVRIALYIWNCIKVEEKEFLE